MPQNQRFTPDHFVQIIDTPFDPEFIRLTQQAFSKTITGYTARAMTVLPSDEPGMRPLVTSKVGCQKRTGR